jgi:hypothetical protein
VEVEDSLALQVAERPLHDRWQFRRLGSGLMGGFEGADILLGRLHRRRYAPSE